ncbi:hypothetical protein Hdeb2414_s0001g00013491 [Helianthus debilis subsp. tardiflorus]
MRKFRISPNLKISSTSNAKAFNPNRFWPPKDENSSSQPQFHQSFMQSRSKKTLEDSIMMMRG